MKLKTGIIALSLLTAIACGRKAEEDKTKQENPQSEIDNKTETPSDATSEEYAFEKREEETTDLYDQAIESLQEDMVSESGVSLSLAEDDSSEPSKFERTKNCIENDDATATVTLNLNYENTFPVRRIFWQGDHKVVLSHEDTRLWQPAEGDIMPCHPTKNHVVIPIEKLEGVKLDVTFDRSAEHVRNLVSKLNSDKKAATSNGKATGEISVEALSVTTNDENSTYEILRQHTLTAQRGLSIEGTYTGKTFNGQASFELNQEVEISAEDPFKVLVERDQTTYAWMHKTIQSGTITGINKTVGILTELSFDNVKFATKSKCSAYAGTINGKKYLEGEEEPYETFVITFSENGATKAVNGGEAQPFLPRSCASL